MAIFNFPVAHTVTLDCSGKERRYNVLAMYPAEIEEIAIDDLQAVASWEHYSFKSDGNHQHKPGYGSVFVHQDRFLTPVFIRTPMTDEAPRPLTLTNLLDAMKSTDAVGTFSSTLFQTFKSNGARHEVFADAIAEGGWRPHNLPSGRLLNTDYDLQLAQQEILSRSLVLVGDHLFAICPEPVIGCLYSSKQDQIVLRIGFETFFHDDFETFRLDRWSDAIEFSSQRWPGKPVDVLARDFQLHHDGAFSFNDDGANLLKSAFNAYDDLKIKVSSMTKENGLNMLRLRDALPKLNDDGRVDDIEACDLDKVYERLLAAQPAFKSSHEKERVAVALDRWNLRPLSVSLMP